MADDDYSQRSVRIYRMDWLALHRVQMEREAELRRKPSMAELIHEAVTKMAGNT